MSLSITCPIFIMFSKSNVFHVPANSFCRLHSKLQMKKYAEGLQGGWPRKLKLYYIDQYFNSKKRLRLVRMEASRKSTWDITNVYLKK